MEDKNTFPHGTVHISNDIIAVIAIKAATEVEGVCDVAGSQTVKHDLSEHRKRVKGKMTVIIQDGFVYVDVPVILRFDTSVQEVSEEIQLKIKEQIEMITGLTVVEVNVFVEDLEIKN